MIYTFETLEAQFSVEIDFLLDDNETYNVFVYHPKGTDNLTIPLEQLENLIKGKWLVFPDRKVVFRHFANQNDMRRSFYKELSEYSISYSNLKHERDTYKRFNKTIIVMTALVIVALLNYFFFRSDIAYISSVVITLNILCCAIAPWIFLRKHENAKTNKAAGKVAG